MLGFAFLAASLDAVTKAMTAHYPVPQLLWIRFLGQTLGVLALVPWVGATAVLRTSSPRIQFARGVLLFMSAALFVFALSHLPFATAKVLAFVAPILVVALSAPLLGERVGRGRTIAVAIGFVGVLVVARPGAAPLDWAMALPVASACTYALYQLLTRRVANSDPPYVSLFYISMVGLLLVSLAAPFVWRTLDPAHWPLLLLHGAAVGLGHFLQIRALAFAPPSLIAPFGYLSLLWAVGYGMIFFDEPFDPWTVVGGLIIAACGIHLVRGAR